MNIVNSSLHLRMLFLWVLVSFVSGLQAQDIHFSQFGNAPLQRSPALTGVFEGDMRFMGNYRAQWYNVPVTYRTINAAFDKRFVGYGDPAGFFSGGLVFNYDQAGDSKLGTMMLGLNGSFTHRIAKGQALTAGLQVAGYQRSFRTDDLRWDEQFNGKFYESTLSANESTLFNNKSIFYADFSVGLNWHLRSQKRKARPSGSTRQSRTSLDLGGGWFHINRPNTSFFDEEGVRLPARYSLYGLGTFDLGNRFDLLLNAMGQYQGPAREHLISAAGRIHLNDKLTQELALSLGVGYRFNEGFTQGDAIYPFLLLNMRSWQFGVSYDINISGFRGPTSGLGGPEFSAIYIFKKVPVVDFCPTCPVYL